MKRFKKVLVPMIILSMVLSGCGKSEDVSVDIEEELTAVEVQSISVNSIEKELVYVGQVKSNETVSVTSKLSGQVDKVYYDIGDEVKKGDVLFTIDKKDINDQIKQLEASLKISNASVATAQTGLQQINGGQTASSRLQMEKAVENAKIASENAKIALETSQINLDNSKISLDNSQANLNDVSNTYENMKTLYNAGVISKSEFDSTELKYTQLKNSYDTAQNSYNQTLNAYNQAKNSYDQSELAYNQAIESLDIFNNKTLADSTQTAQNGVSSAVASRESVMTQLEIARETLNDTSVTAPISGVISTKNISETNMVSAQSAPFTIVDMSIVTVDVNVSEKLINLLNVGQNVDVVIPTINKDIMTGKIKSVTPVVDNTNTYPVKIEINNSNGTIKPGMFAEIHFIESQNDNAFVVPRNTILEDEEGYYVYTVKDNIAMRTYVSTGIDNGKEIELVSGVSSGDIVIVSGHNYVEDGESIKIVDNNDALDVNEEETQETTSKEE